MKFLCDLTTTIFIDNSFNSPFVIILLFLSILRIVETNTYAAYAPNALHFCLGKNKNTGEAELEIHHFTQTHWRAVCLQAPKRHL